MSMDLYSKYGASLDRLRERFKTVREESEKEFIYEQAQAAVVADNSNVIPISAGREKDN